MAIKYTRTAYDFTDAMKDLNESWDTSAKKSRKLNEADETSETEQYNAELKVLQKKLRELNGQSGRIFNYRDRAAVEKQIYQVKSEINALRSKHAAALGLSIYELNQKEAAEYKAAKEEREKIAAEKAYNKAKSLVPEVETAIKNVVSDESVIKPYLDKLAEAEDAAKRCYIDFPHQDLEAIKNNITTSEIKVDNYSPNAVYCHVYFDSDSVNGVVHNTGDFEKFRAFVYIYPRDIKDSSIYEIVKNQIIREINYEIRDLDRFIEDCEKDAAEVSADSLSKYPEESAFNTELKSAIESGEPIDPKFNAKLAEVIKNTVEDIKRENRIWAGSQDGSDGAAEDYAYRRGVDPLRRMLFGIYWKAGDVVCDFGPGPKAKIEDALRKVIRNSFNSEPVFEFTGVIPGTSAIHEDMKDKVVKDVYNFHLADELDDLVSTNYVIKDVSTEEEIRKEDVPGKEALKDILNFIKNHRSTNINIWWEDAAELGQGDVIVDIFAGSERKAVYGKNSGSRSYCTNYPALERKIKNALHLHNIPLLWQEYNDIPVEKYLKLTNDSDIK